ncbi:hypothetical protein Tco_1173802 [Tanacetum coccineum]
MLQIFSQRLLMLADESVYKEWEDRMEMAATTASSLVAEQDSGSGPRCQDTILGGAEAQIRFEATSKQSNDPSLSRVNTLRSGEDNMKLKELMEFYTKIESAKAKIVNGERQIQALVDKKKVIITETSIRSDLKLDDAERIDCVPTTLIFTELERMSAKTTTWNEFSSTMTSAIICLATNQTFNFSKYIFNNMVKYLEGGVKFLMYPRRKQRKDSGPTEPVTDEAHVYTPSYNLPQSGDDSMQLSELMNLCTSLQEKVLDLEKAKTAQAKEIASLKKRVKQLEKRRKLRTLSLGAQEGASKQGRKIEDLDADLKQEIEFEKVVEEPVVSVATTSKSIPVSAAEVVTTASVEIPDELTLAQTLIEIKTAKPKPVTTAVTTFTSVRPRAKGIIFHDQEEQVPASTKTFSSLQSQLPQVKDKGKGKMVEPEKPLKKKDQIALDEEMARNLEAQMQAELIEEKRLARQKEEEANIVLIESWDNT